MEEEIGRVLGLYSHCYGKRRRGEETDDGRVGWVREAGGGDGEENFHSWFVLIGWHHHPPEPSPFRAPTSHALLPPLL